MSDFIVSARKYRPLRFGDVVGQAHITTTLRNAIRSGQLAHSFLFCGPRGVGKTTCARILAQSINCEKPVDGVEPCGQCGPCKSFRESSSFNIYEIDAASNNSVEDIRALTDQVRFPPQAGRYKVYIIDEVHMLSQAAFNAFLKTLEEPPSYAVFILATTEKHKIIPTILSRCQIFDFNRIQVSDIAGYLQGICEAEKIPFDPQGLHVIAQKADGGMRDALSMFDRILAFAGGSVRLPEVLENLNILDYDVFFGLVDGFLAEDLPVVLHGFQRVLERGFEGDIFLSGLAEHLRNLLVAKDPATHDLLELTDSLSQRYISQAETVSGSFLVSALGILNQADIHFKASRHKRLHVETALVKLTYLNRALDFSAAIPAAGVKKKQHPEPLTQATGHAGAAPASAASLAAPPAEAPAPASAASPAAPPAEARAPASATLRAAPPSEAPAPASAAPRAAPPAEAPAPASATRPAVPPAEAPAPASATPPAAPPAEAPAPASATLRAAPPAEAPAPPAPASTPPGKSPVPVAGGVKIPSLKDLSASLRRQTTPAGQATNLSPSAETAPAQAVVSPAKPEPSLSALRQCWSDHLKSLMAANRMSIAKLMESARLESEPGGRLKVFVDNKIQLELLKAELPAFRERLVSGDLAVPEISLEIQPDTRHDENQIPHSAQDRLAQMARKNPLVEQLRDKLGLELEF